MEKWNSLVKGRQELELVEVFKMIVKTLKV